MAGILGFDFYLGPSVDQPEPIDWTLPLPEASRRQDLWVAAILQAVRDEDAWALLTTKPHGDVILFDVRPQSIWPATRWGGSVHLLLAREASRRLVRM